MLNGVTRNTQVLQTAGKNLLGGSGLQTDSPLLFLGLRRLTVDLPKSKVREVLYLFRYTDCRRVFKGLASDIERAFLYVTSQAVSS